MRRPPTVRLRVAAALVGITALLVPLALARTAAAAAVPASPAFSGAIDPYARYEAETGCSPTEKPGPQVLRALLRSTYGSTSFGIVRACTSAESGHEEGRALDWMMSAANPTQKATADGFLAWLLASDKYGNANALARRFGIMYIIWNKRMWRAYNPSAGWQPYTGSVPHTDHVHFSFSWDGAYARTSWYTGRAACPVPAAVQNFGGVPLTGLAFTGVTPYRLLDTRDGTGTQVGACRLAAGARLDLQVTGRGPVPASGVTAVVLNLTGVRPTGTTYLGAYPAGTTWPGTSSLNVMSGAVTAAAVVVPVGSDGKVSIVNGGAPVDVLADVAGYYAAGSGDLYSPVTPARVLDTRTGSPLAAGTHRSLPVAGSAGVPAGATGVVVNVTSTRATSAGWLAVSPSNTGVPTTSTLNVPAGASVANRAFVRLDAGALDLYASATMDAVVDVVGWFGPGGAGLRYVPLSPSRVLDTRSGTGIAAPLAASASSTLHVAGSGGVPSTARAVALTLTGTGATQTTYVAAWPSDAGWGGTSDLDLVTAEARANLLVCGLSPDGSIDLKTGAGQTQVIGDVLGYYTAG